jgi:hypothetical protein
MRGGELYFFEILSPDARFSCDTACHSTFDLAFGRRPADDQRKRSAFHRYEFSSLVPVANESTKMGMGQWRRSFFYNPIDALSLVLAATGPKKHPTTATRKLPLGREVAKSDI